MCHKSNLDFSMIHNLLRDFLWNSFLLCFSLLFFYILLLLLCAKLPTVPLRTQAGAEVLYDRHVTHIHRRDSGWEVCHKGGASQQFDVVVLTMPVPQILQLQGDVGSCEYITTTTNGHTHTLAFKFKYDFWFCCLPLFLFKISCEMASFYYII